MKTNQCRNEDDCPTPMWCRGKDKCPRAKEPRKIGWLARLVRRWRVCPKQTEINRLRSVLHAISDSRPDAHMDIEKNPELVNWICDTCHKASVGAYPSNANMEAPNA